METNPADLTALVTDLLDQIEREQRAVLEALKCPNDVLAVREIINGLRPSPWPVKDARRNGLRATYATFALTFVNKTRLYLDPAAPIPAMAAYNALFAGAFASDTVLSAAKQAASQHGSLKGIETRREKAPQKAAEHDVSIFALADEYGPVRSSETAKLDWIARMLRERHQVEKSTKTIKRRLSTRVKE